MARDLEELNSSRRGAEREGSAWMLVLVKATRPMRATTKAQPRGMEGERGEAGMRVGFVEEYTPEWKGGAIAARWERPTCLLLN